MAKDQESVLRKRRLGVHFDLRITVLDLWVSSGLSEESKRKQARFLLALDSKEHASFYTKGMNDDK